MSEAEKKVPELRFKEFNERWVKKRLNESCTFFSGGTPTSSNKNYYDGNIPFIGSGNIHHKEVESFITKEALQHSSAKLVEKGDLLYALYGANSGDVAISEIKGAINQAILCIRTEELNIYFVALLLSYNENKIVARYLQGGQGNLSAKIVKNLKFYFPSFPEQQKIADFLSAVDQKIQQLQRKKELLEQYKKGMMQNLFAQEIRFKQEDGSDFPDWEEKKLGHFLQERSEYPDKELPLYSLTIENGIVPKTDRYERSFLVKDNRKAYKVMRQNDFAFNPMNLRYGALARHKENKVVSVSKYYNIFYCNEFANNLYFETYLTSYNMIQYYNKMATGSLEEKKRVHYLDFINFNLRFPSLLEQQKIANFLSALDEKVEKVGQQIEKAQEFKKGLLQKMFI
ncbi:restriction endonuclease subunit S [Marivirga arenosa]|uniref:Restriction endonuclease subunit S n=1 Tax=Marivirga arenosa TaxID=3059076 RepID=A0AA49JA00_9BACT|nr:restriction endonuclease subunit S [Marivirga sp. BKB1-2]WKK79332.2 restriction endonuclease subunit S [Marivirga sp. BKB1-2]